MTDLNARCFIKRGSTLVPADGAAGDMLAEIGEGHEIMVTVRRARSPENHRWFFACLRLVVENTDRFGNEDELLDALKLATGHVERRARMDGTIYLSPKSINFAAMDQLAFRRFIDRALFVIQRDLDIDAKALAAEVNADQRAA